MTEVAEGVIAVIARRVRVDRPIGLQDRLTDLGLGSLDAVELVFDLEEHFDVRIHYNVNEFQAGFETVRQIVGAIEHLLAQKTGKA